MTTIALVWVGEAVSAPAWTKGSLRTVRSHHGDIRMAMEQAATTDEAVLVWDAALGEPPSSRAHQLLTQPADCWHGGLDLGQNAQPALINHVAPCWMLNRDPDPSIEVSSWRLSLRALLVRSEVIHELGGPGDDFETLSGAGLDLGLRWIRGGAILRHVPAFVPLGSPADDQLSPSDQARIISRSWGRWWSMWSCLRGWYKGSLNRRALPPVRTAWRSEKTSEREFTSKPSQATDPGPVRVSVIVPTVDRYHYLETLLRQLADQSVAPHEVVVIDQTEVSSRHEALDQVAPGLPLTLLHLDEAGQCRSRNAGILASSGDVLLFLDDDDEIPTDLVELHLARLRPGIDAVCGGVDDATAGPPPEGFRHRRVSDVFPTNNTMVRRETLRDSGLFDPTYDRGARADHDLGMRLYLSGALSIYDPSVLVFHHHAPRGGLRTHGVRLVTRVSSRRQVTQRDLPGTTESYLNLRYFQPDQTREHEMILALSQLGGDGSRLHRTGRFAAQLILLPDTFRKIRSTRKHAELLRAHRPEIPGLP